MCSFPIRPRTDRPSPRSRARPCSASADRRRLSPRPGNGRSGPGRSSDPTQSGHARSSPRVSPLTLNPARCTTTWLASRRRPAIATPRSPACVGRSSYGRNSRTGRARTPTFRASGTIPNSGRSWRYRGPGADRDLERQLGQAAPAAAAALAGRAPPGRRLPAGDEARRRRVRRAARRRAGRPRLRGRGPRRGGVERRGDPLARRAGRRGRGAPRRAGLPASGGARGVGHLRRDPGGLGVRAERARRRTPSTTSTSSRGWRRCARWWPPARRRRSCAAT